MKTLVAILVVLAVLVPQAAAVGSNELEARLREGWERMERSRQNMRQDIQAQARHDEQMQAIRRMTPSIWHQPAAPVSSKSTVSGETWLIAGSIVVAGGMLAWAIRRRPTKTVPH